MPVMIRHPGPHVRRKCPDQPGDQPGRQCPRGAAETATASRELARAGAEATGELPGQRCSSGSAPPARQHSQYAGQPADASGLADHGLAGRGRDNGDGLVSFGAPLPVTLAATRSVDPTRNIPGRQAGHPGADPARDARAQGPGRGPIIPAGYVLASSGRAPAASQPLLRRLWHGCPTSGRVARWAADGGDDWRTGAERRSCR